MAHRRVRVRVTGIVQGVGFRPHVFRLAGELKLGGWVRNDERGVVLEAEGEADAVERFLVRLEGDAPPMAKVDGVGSEALDPTGEREFRIVESNSGGESFALIAPDRATCEACLKELFDPADRRHGYPFINCTDCGPRFTIVRGVPYDRPLTTMAGFEMCGPCQAEYDDPRDRRFHAQPNACPVCGPQVSLVGAEPATGADALARAVVLLGGGAVLAVKGVGGYHLACHAGDDAAVRALRERKHREDRPLALMAPDLPSALALVELTHGERELLAGPERPIVVARRREGAGVADSVARRTRDLGVMLPYSPLHHLLLASVGAPLVMTSGNVSDEPIAFEDADARSRLEGIADAFLVHDRPIHIRTDDSVVRALDRTLSPGPLLIRRSRGWVPGALELPFEAPEAVLGCGAELKSTFCLAKGSRAFVSHHIGDLSNWETLSSYRDGIEHFEQIFVAKPAVVAHDEHPDYLSTRYALEREGVRTVAVQHHHAHLAACLAEHGEKGTAVAAIFDGTGYGPDGTVWGGELLVGDIAGSERAGFLFPVRLPGGDAAAREPWRMACSWLVQATGSESPSVPPALRNEVEMRDWKLVCEMAVGGVAAPLTTSMGRLFDAAAALCGVRARVSYEGQAAAELEGLADPAERGGYELPVIAEGEGPVVLDARELVRGVAGDVEAGVPAPIVSARFHNSVARGTAGACLRECDRRGTDLVALSGGVFQNRLLLEATAALVVGGGARVVFPRKLPPNDGGVSYGQVAVTCARLQSAPGGTGPAGRSGQVGPTYQSPKSRPNAPNAGISTAR